MKTPVHFTGRSIIFTTLFFTICLMTSSCSKDNNNDNTGNNDTTANPNEVIMSGMSFSPSSLTVKAGTKVTWKNNDSVSHTVTSDNGLFDSGNIGISGSYSFTFTATGTYAYHCNIHTGMTGTVIVN